MSTASSRVASSPTFVADVQQREAPPAQKKLLCSGIVSDGGRLLLWYKTGFSTRSRHAHTHTQQTRDPCGCCSWSTLYLYPCYGAVPPILCIISFGLRVNGNKINLSHDGDSRAVLACTVLHHTTGKRFSEFFLGLLL